MSEEVRTALAQQFSIYAPILAAKDAEIAYLKRAWAATEALENMNEERYERTIATLRAQVAAKDAEIAGLNIQLAAGAQNMSRIQDERSTLRAQVETLTKERDEALTKAKAADILDAKTYSKWREERARNAALEEAALIARNGCLVPPDGGSPTKDETDVCDRIESQIRALISKGE